MRPFFSALRAFFASRAAAFGVATASPASAEQTHADPKEPQVDVTVPGCWASRRDWTGNIKFQGDPPNNDCMAVATAVIPSAAFCAVDPPNDGRAGHPPGAGDGPDGAPPFARRPEHARDPQQQAEAVGGDHRHRLPPHATAVAGRSQGHGGQRLRRSRCPATAGRWRPSASRSASTRARRRCR